MRVNDQIEVYFADSRNWYDAVVDAVDDDGSCHLKFGDGHEGWYAVEEATVKQMLDRGKFSRKLKWRPAGQPASKPATKPAKRPLPASPSEEPAEEPEPQQRRKQKKAVAPKRPDQAVEVVDMVDAEPEADDGRPRRAAAKRGVAYMRSSLEEIDRDSMDGLSSENEDSAPRKRAPTKRGKATKQAKKEEGDGSDFEEDDGDEEEEEADEDASDYVDSDSDEKPRRRTKKGGKQAASKKGAKAASSAPQKGKPTKEEKVAEAEEWRAICADPPTWRRWKKPAEKPGFSKVRELRSRRGHLFDKSARQHYEPYLDSPFDINDRGVSHIVTDQARKMSGLLADALRNGELPPIALQTLCSGTDAPAIALSLISKEFNTPARAGQGLQLSVEHTASCENEPYKQAYISRNFPGVPIFNDVVDLADRAQESGVAKTAFGGEKAIPSSKPGQRSLLVAGTSCKDFSARKRATGVKLDIEDMGTSGSTFMATVDYLFATGQDMLLLENVQGAPWDKMAAYITGRVGLVSAMKGITSSQKAGGKQEAGDDGDDGKDGSINKTILTVEKDKKRTRLVVTQVAKTVGLKLGVACIAFSSRAGGEKKVDVECLGLKPGGTIELKALASKLGLSTKTPQEGDELIFEMPVQYQAKKIWVDSKKFGLPHTRNRGYLLAWKVGTFGAMGEDEVGTHWEQLVHGLQTELEHPIEAFMLPDSSDRIRRFRDVLRSPIAQRLALDNLGKNYYGQNKDADTRYNLGYRSCFHHMVEQDRGDPSNKDPKKREPRATVAGCSAQGANMEVDARPLTRWGPHAPPKLLSHMWLQEVIAFWSQHSLDHIDVKALKNAEAGVDLLHHNVLLDLSQNVHMTDTINAPGVTGCLTPGGSMFHIRRGREISGYEKLLLSGIPADALLLGGESEVQLSDLAGNAMSMPVVSACLLAAFCIEPFARAKAAAEAEAEAEGEGEAGAKSKGSKKKAASGAKAKKAAFDASPLLQLAQSDPVQPSTAPPGGDFEKFCYRDSCDALARRAERCSVLCTCESSGDVSVHAIQRCKCCLLTSCSMCAGRLQLESHDMCQLCTAPASAESDRFDGRFAEDAGAAPEQLEKELRRTLPDVFCLNSPLDLGGAGAEKAVIGTEPLRLSRVERDRDRVTLRYVSYRGATAAAMLAVSYGRLGATSNGVTAVLFDLSTGKRGPLTPAARLLRHAGSPTMADEWQVSEPTQAKLTFEALDGATSPSYRAEMGLVDFAKEVWADRLRVSGAGAVAGVYMRQKCRGMMAFGAMWRREDEQREPMWLLVDPDIDRTAPDRLVFTTTPTYLDGRAHHVAELLLDEDEPVHEWLYLLGQAALPGGGGEAASSSSEPKKKKSKKEATGTVTVETRLLGWKAKPAVQLRKRKGGPSVNDVEAEDGYPSFVVGGLPAETMETLRKSSDQHGKLSILAASSTVAERRLAESLASPLLRLTFDAKDGLATPKAGAQAWGDDPKMAPRRPSEDWRDGRRFYDTEASNAYEKRMSERPPAWEVQLKKGKGAVEVRPRVPVVAHQAAEKLLRGRGLDADAKGKLHVEWKVGTRLDARYKLNFPIKSSEKDDAGKQPPQGVWGEGLSLYPRQLKVLEWMQAIEREDKSMVFDERDVTDAQLPSVGWQLQAKASIKGPLRGGVLADALGAGKTVTVIALIANDVAAARKLPLSKSKTGGDERRHSRASLIVVPPLLIRQWEAEIERFSGGKLVCLRVESAAQLQRLSCKQLREADIVLCVSDLLGCNATGRAASFSKSADKDAKQTSQEASKEAVRAQERLAEYGAKERAQLTKELDDRKDSYLQQLTAQAGTDDLPPFLHRRNKNREAGGGDTETIIYGVWISRSSRDPFGKTKGRQEDREAAAAFSHQYARVALPALRSKAFGDDAKGVPIEWFVWRRVIIDECHEPLCMGAEDADDSAMSSKRSSCAVRELLGIALPDVASRPLLAQRGTFGLTGTPLLSSVARITELASLCAGTYVTGAANHWRMIERASGRDLFLRYHDTVPSRLYQAETVHSAQEFVSLAARRNVAEKTIDAETKMWYARLASGSKSKYENMCDEIARDDARDDGGRKDEKDKKVKGSLAPDLAGLSDGKFEKLVGLAAMEPVRQTALATCVADIQSKERLAKVLVFAPVERRAFEAAERAVRALKAPDGGSMPVEVVWPGEQQEKAATDVLAFNEEPSEQSYKDKKPRVLLLAYEDGAGLNLQHGCHHVVLFAPLAGAAQNSEQIIAAIGKEQQSIGRVRRQFQKHKVTIHRLLLKGPKDERTLDAVLTDRNMDEAYIRQATNTAGS